MARAKTPPVFSGNVPGPWGVDTIGNVWCVIHRETLAAKRIGQVGASRANYFDSAIEEADRRNRRNPTKD